MPKFPSRAFHPAGHRYRPDVDGLRAIAVVAVMLFHYHVPGFRGGFIGVDIFFVISGYLITGLVTQEMREDRFSILRFYERRVRRIFPALFVMLAAASLVGALLLFPADFKRFGRSLLATALFASNIEFLRDVNYFHVASVQRPLLHLWSIAVEEQFYLIFPALLLLVRHRGRRVPLMLVGGLMAASFAFSEWGVLHEPGWAFYLLPSRMWELMVGALLAIAGIAAPNSRALRESLALAGLAAIAWGIFTFRPHMHFPGAAALVPCLGTMLVIYAGRGGEVGWVTGALSFRPVVFVGLISYSLYLWHWPVYVYLHYYLYRGLHPIETIGVIVASFVLAVLSWRFVEQPFRRPRLARARRSRAPFAFGGAAIAAALLCSTTVVASDGFPHRFKRPIRKVLAEERDNDGLLDACFGLPLKDINAHRLCRFGAGKDIAPSILLWGDSHADAILPAVRDIAREAGIEGWFAGQPSCAPLIGVYRPDAWHCKRFNDRVIRFVTLHPQIKTVILEARWAKNADGRAYGDEGHGFVQIGDAVSVSHKPSENAAIFTRGLERTIAALRAAHKKVILIGSVPEIGWTVPVVLARQMLSGRAKSQGPSLAEYKRRQRVVLPLFHKLAAQEGVRAYFPHLYFCRTGRCEVRENGIPLYRDEHHLSVYGAKKLEPMLAGMFAHPES